MWRSSENTVTLTYKGVAWKWEWSHSVVSNSLRPHGLQPTMEEVPGFSVHGIFQARILEWVAISFSRRSSLPRDWTLVSWIVGRHFTIWTTREVHQEAVRKGAEYRFAKILIKGKMKPKLVEFKWKVLLLSHVWLFATSWTLAHQAPLSMEFSMQEYWSGQLFPSPGNLQLFL